MAVDIIIPYFNSRNYIRSTVMAVLNQNLEDVFCIMVDDGSTDGTFELVNELIAEVGDEVSVNFSNTRRPIEFRSGGRGAKNYGYQLGQSEFVVFLDSDDIIHSNYIKERLEFLISWPDYDLVISNFGWKVNSRFPYRVYEYDKNFILNINKDDTDFWNYYQDIRFWFNPSNPMWRRCFLEKQMGKLWDEDLYIGEDYEFHGRMLLDGARLGFVDTVTWDYMYNDDSMMANCINPNVLITQSFAKHKLIKCLMTNANLNADDILSKHLIWQIKLLRKCVSESALTKMKISPLSLKLAFNQVAETLSLLNCGFFFRNILLFHVKCCMAIFKTGFGYSLFLLLTKDKFITNNQYKINIYEK